MKEEWHKTSLQMKWQKIDASLAYNTIHLPKF